MLTDSRCRGPLLALWLVGCSEDGNCAALCQHTAHFVYAQPIAGQSFEIALAPQGAIFSCQLAQSGEATREPNWGRFQLEFAREGLRSLSWSYAPAGTLRIDVTVDGIRVTSQTFEYQPGGGDACSGTCSESPRFELEASRP